MTPKKMMLLFILLSNVNAFAQQDKLHFLTEMYQYALRSKSQLVLGPGDNEPFGFGYEWYDLNGANGAVSGANNYYAITDGNPNSVDQAIGVNSANYLYYVGVNDGFSAYNIYSVNTTGGYQAATNRQVANDVGAYHFEQGGALGVDRLDKAWFMTHEGQLDDDFNLTGYMVRTYSFQTNASGDVSGFATNGQVLPPADIPFATVQDICFDLNDNMFLLVANGNPYDGTYTDPEHGQITYYICQLTAAQVADLAAGMSVTMQRRWQITRADGTPVFINQYGISSAGGGTLPGEAVLGGLALTNAGRLLVNATESSDATTHAQYVWELVPSGSNTTAINTTSVTAAYTGSAQGGSFASDLATNIFNIVLPVKFGQISGQLVGNRLTLDWVSETETNNHYFEVQLSRNGADFVTIGDRIMSKTTNGTSGSSLQYDFSYDLSGLPGMAGLYGAAGLVILLLALSLGIMPLRKFTYQALGGMVVLMMLGMGIGCQKKAGDEIETNPGSRYYVRIMQVDKDGKQSFSKIISIRREN